MKKYTTFFAVCLAVFALAFFAFAHGKGREASQEHLSEVADVARKLSDIAGKNSNIGAEIREVAKEQSESAERASEAIDKIEDRGGFKTFLIGTDYKNIGQLRSELVTTTNHIERLTKSLERTASETTKLEISAQIKALEEIKAKTESFIKENESKFSILGWIFRLFSR